MEVRNEDALFVVKHPVTVKSLLHMEKGIQIRGLRAIKKILNFFFIAAVLCLLIKGALDGGLSAIVAALGSALLLISIAGRYILFRGWQDTKKGIKEKFEEEHRKEEWEYRFYEDCYEVIGEHERSVIQYSNVWRLIDMSGLLVLAEKGDVIRNFWKSEIKKGESAELVSFLERKCGMQVESVSVK